MSSRSLPERPSLAQLKIQAKELQRAHHAGRPDAAARVRAHHPRGGETAGSPLSLAEAQLVLAREYGFSSWAVLKHTAETGARVAGAASHPRFDDAVGAVDAGDVGRLRGLLSEHPELVRARTKLDPPFDYFTGATLLHHVARNPSRGTGVPQNLPEIASLLLDAGADVDAVTLGPAPGTTLGLVLTSKEASDAGVSGPLIEVLLARGATGDVGPEAVRAALANHAPAAASHLLARGARANLATSAGLGLLDAVRACFDADGGLRAEAAVGDPRTEIGLALLLAYVNGHPEVVDFLFERDGDWSVTGVGNGTALHRAAWDGDLEMVRRLVAAGADIGNRDNPFTSTPLSWAHQNGKQGVFAWLRAHGEIDIHDAVCFGLREHVDARLRADPSSVNLLRDQWTMPSCAPLHWAAWPHTDVGGEDRAELVASLIERGADVNMVAGNGMTALDVADAAQAPEIIALLEDRGGRRAAAL